MKAKIANNQQTRLIKLVRPQTRRKMQALEVCSILFWQPRRRCNSRVRDKGKAAASSLLINFSS